MEIRTKNSGLGETQRETLYRKPTHEIMKILAKALGGNSIAHFARGLSLWTREDVLRMDVIEQTERKFAFNVTRCRYAEMYKELGVQEYGALLSCGRDAALIVGFNPQIRFTRAQTIMSGAPFCDFRYDLVG
jgi:L-2-amino-thiazoline-4-carboxylic acid hydrolase